MYNQRHGNFQPILLDMRRIYEHLITSLPEPCKHFLVLACCTPTGGQTHMRIRIRVHPTATKCDAPPSTGVSVKFTRLKGNRAHGYFMACFRFIHAALLRLPG